MAAPLRITIEPTATTTTMDGVPVRLWEGMTADGIPCKVFVHRVAVAADADALAFERVLDEKLPPGRHVPLSSVL